MMLKAVATALQQGNHIMVEAGTGTGKSIAYLLPCILFSKANKTPVVISTNTLNLQEQLVNKDIPGLARAIGAAVDVKVAVLKGRSNYLCQRRWEASRQGMLGDEIGIRLSPRITAWLTRTRTGDRAELSLNRYEAAYWTQISAREEECLGERCRFQVQGRCFLFSARQQARSSQLLIVNHALLLADASSDNKLLPPYHHLVVDEAHHLEEVATRQFGFVLSRQGIDDLNQEISRWLRDIDLRLRVSRVAPSVKSEVTRQVLSARSDTGHAWKSITTVWTSLERMFGQDERWTAGSESARAVDSACRHLPAWENIEDEWDETSKLLDTACVELGRLHTGLKVLDQSVFPDKESFLVGLVAGIEGLRQLRELGDQALLHPREDTVYWITIKKKASDTSRHSIGQLRNTRGSMTRLQPALFNISVSGAPLEVATPLNDKLFSVMDTAVLTSATLSSAGDFGYLKRQLGFEPQEELIIDSPFNYLDSTLLCLPEDMPDPRTPGYHDAVACAVVTAALAAGGRTLALFTSHEALKIAHAKLYEDLAKHGMTVLGQVIDGTPEQVLQAFKEGQRMVLLGTSSLWEGIDVVGDALSVLVIARLPFAVPTDPVIEARARLFEDPFREYSLPQAVMRLKQGFGRLIRSENDRGVVLILDRRVHSKAYGKTFIDALPECSQARGTMNELAGQIKDWLNRAHGHVAIS
jgi:DNA polymerase-3 subunit epsilon/ATP-dependent DNA helicase DinG